MAGIMGVPVGYVYVTTVALAGALAGLSGVLAAPIVVVEYQMGLKLLATAFIIVVVGGFGSIAGAVATAIIIGCLDGVLATLIEATHARILTLVIMALVVFWRPEGVFRPRAERLG
jgi:branched-chain amino acid transport system permease protein